MVYTKEEIQEMKDFFGLTRAEYQENLEDCFEGVPVKYLFAPLFNDNDPKLIFGEPGSGKTHLVKLLSKELPLEIHNLNKPKLVDEHIIEYSPIATARLPAAVVVDDVHYLLQCMHLSTLTKGNLKETEVLEKLVEFKDRAEQFNAVPIYVADENIAGLSMRFLDEKNKAKFLELMESCSVNGDDSTMFYKSFGRFPKAGGGALDLNNRGIDYKHQVLPGAVRRLWPEEADKIYEMLEKKLPADLVEHWLVEKLLEQKGLKILDARVKAAQNIINGFKMKDVPYRMPLSMVGSGVMIFYPIGEEGIITNEMFINMRKESIYSKPIANIRQLKLLAEANGGISRQSLDIGFGRRYLGSYGSENYDGLSAQISDWNGIEYTAAEVRKIHDIILNKFRQTVKYDFGSMLKKWILDAETDDEAQAIWIAEGLKFQ